MEVSDIYESIHNCRICGSAQLREILNLGDQPPANSLRSSLTDELSIIPLRILFCMECNVAQLGETVSPRYLFSEYIWATGTSQTTVAYSAKFLYEARRRCEKTQPYVIEIASNDGTFLKRFKEVGARILGIDPAKNIAAEATADGIETIAEFFNQGVARQLLERGGTADIVFARNVLPHAKDIHSILRGITILLDENGLGIIEFHDAQLILEELHYDSIYHEHLFYFTLQTMANLLAQYNLSIFDVVNSPISGGSLVVYFSKTLKPKRKNVISIEKKEEELGLNTYGRWKKFSKQAKAHAADLFEVVALCNNRILAYGASARGATLLNFSRINYDHVSAIIDINYRKHGLFAPGSDLPIISFEKGLSELRGANYILLLAWNFEEEIVRNLRKHGYVGKFIIPLPNEPRII